MQFIKKYHQNIKRLLNILSGIGALSLAGIVLLNLPFFYELSTTESVITFILVSLGLFILTFLSFKAFVYPNLLSIIKRRNITFILFLIIFLSIIISISSNYIWTTPEVYAVEICFDADDTTSPLTVQRLTHPITNRLYPPDSFGFTRYPITIESGQCVNGQITTLLGRYLRYTQAGHLAITVREDPPDGRFFISIDEAPSVVLFEDNPEQPISNTIQITNGFFIGSPWTSSLSRLGFYGTRLVLILLSSITLSLFLFGLTERTFSYSPGEGKLIKFTHLFKNIKIKQPPTHKVLLVFVLVYFFLFGLMMAHTSGQPDQRVHGYISHRFTETWGIPEDDPESTLLISGQPFLYYWINGTVAKTVQWLTPGSEINNVLLWRITSVLMSTGTVYYLYKLTTKLTGNPYAGILSSFFLSNTLMFVFNSGGINYDNLMNLGSMAAIYHLVSIYKGNNYFRNTAAMGSWLVVAALSKEQALLVAFVVFLPWLLFSIKNFTKLGIRFDKRSIIIGLIFLGFVFSFIALYGVNYIQYGRLTPGCTQIKPPEKCTGFSHRLRYRSNTDLQSMWFERDRFHNPVQYAFTYWIIHIARSIWGILSHNTFVPMLTTGLHTIFALWGVFCLVRLWDKKDGATNAILFVVIGFTAYLFYFNYRTEVRFSFMHYGVTGRYLLPVFGAFLALTTYYILKIRAIYLKRLSLILAILLYFAGGLGMFISRYAEVFVHWRIFYF